MGSSPVTATIRTPRLELLSALEHFLDSHAGGAVLVAFSGGPDSTALLWGLAQVAAAKGVRLAAAHLDHGLDPGSAGRATQAAELAATLGVDLFVERRSVGELRQPGESLEAAARHIRYAFLEEARRKVNAAVIATGHHRDDQAETVLLRLAFGSGLRGLAGIQAARGAVARPLLELARADLAAALAGSGLEPVEDPTNRSLAHARNRVRSRLLPRLAATDLGLAARLPAVARAARGAARRIDALLLDRLAPVNLVDGVSVLRTAFEALPEELRPHALALLHERAGAPLPSSHAAQVELARQLGGSRTVGCDCGGGFRWESRKGRLVLFRTGPAPGPFTYTLRVPGELDLPEIAARIRLYQGPVATWMFRGGRDRAGLNLPLVPGDVVEIRSRRPGDRIRPLGCQGSRRLKELLIDRGLPRRHRDSLPLLCAGGSIAWVPGVTVAEGCRVEAGGTVWIAELAGAEVRCAEVRCGGPAEQSASPSVLESGAGVSCWSDRPWLAREETYI